MKDHEKRIRDFMSERATMRGLCPEQISGVNGINLNTTDLRALLADLDAVRVNAARYDYLREAHWANAELCCVLDPKTNVKLGAMCPTGENLDCHIDAALKGAEA